MDKMQIENGYSFLLRDINRMLKKMNYDEFEGFDA